MWVVSSTHRVLQALVGLGSDHRSPIQVTIAVIKLLGVDLVEIRKALDIHLTVSLDIWSQRLFVEDLAALLFQERRA